MEKENRETEPRKVLARIYSQDGTEVILCVEGSVVIYTSTKKIAFDSSNPNGSPPPPPGNP